MSRFSRWIVAIAIFVMAGLLLHIWIFLRTSVVPPGPVLVDITPGRSAWSISRAIQEEGIITHASTFMAIAVFSGKANRLQAGSYVFEGKHYPMDIMNILFRGETQRYRVTIPEGYTLNQIGAAVGSTGLVSAETFVDKATNPEITSFFQVEAPSMEGFLYPDTYFLVPNMTPLEIMAKMVDRFKMIYTPDMDRQAGILGMSRLEVITMASIIEKEAVVQAEKPLISSVFHNRLRKGMRLQSDPTAVYGVKGFSGKVTPDDLLRESPYNTYRHQGLPPGPICNPGIESITAALRPAKTDYLYFVARGDGTHIFTRSLQEHNRAISGNIR